ncbi:AAA family ATPase [Mannheimia haemolytica]|uniref:AAA family ATPase n=1 Tax=Mannheimia haemolytica TaxID=75985 RepID=UPI0001BCF7F9|nr:AAA family ATPase [Mannheimia haemolytica]EEY08713.1 DNA transposition protein [Mannheimia haemolytica serotype A2 str. OVINE]EEY13343.1 DNA transposition protein [Mannheimia haemolytica serotype A2 str. BOVINE]MDW0723557.1 AAA family ATPase [Mannheimia haemolytica]MDW0736588.1 AAA family ATPase [Mannheimia haemolytica]TRC15176.1 DNA transposition protein [Mannheimia haemolytica]
MNLIDQIKQHLSQTGVTQNQLARESGINAGALSSYLNGSYAGDIANLEAKLTAYFAKKEVQAREFVEAPAFIETATARQIFKTLEFAQIANCMATVYGMSGVGKTKAIQEFKKGRANVWLVTASPSRSSLSEILYEIALELGISDAPRRKGTLSRLIARKIKGTEGLLIVDKADHLPYEALEELRIMQEEANIGLVLVGNDKVYTRMKGGISPHHEYARLWSRVAKNTSIQKTKQADTKAVAKAWGLEEDTEALKVMQSITETGGGLRILTQTLRLAGIVAKGLDRAITADLIIQARQELLGKGD